MKTLQSIFLLLLMLAFAGCEQIIDPNDPNFEPALFVYGFVGPDELPQIILTETRPNEGWFEQIIEVNYPKGLSPSILADGEEQTLNEKEGISTFYNFGLRALDTSYTVFYEGNQVLPDSGTYTFKLQYKGQEVSATTQVPKRVSLDTVYPKIIKYEDTGGSWEEEVLVAEFQDPPASSEAYRLHYGYTGLRRVATFDSDGQFLGFNDTISVVERNVRSTLSDEGLDGQKMALNINPYFNIIPNYDTLPDGSVQRYYTLWVFLETQSNEMQRFQESVEAQSFGYGDPFVEPTFIKSNVEGGLGIFGAFQKSDTLWVKYYQ
ncbi:MAG: DUF4249 family protein [Bacteroidota bacterium]